MRIFRFLAVILVGVTLSGCASSKFKTYNGPEVTRIVVDKSDRRMHLYHHNRVLESYNFGLGFAPEGDKTVEGDGKTPEGLYYIDRRNPNSRFHLSIGISYPNEADIELARALGQSAGGDIFIHGKPNTREGKRWARGRGRDWTWGCIAVADREIQQIYAMVKDGTPILITP